MPEKCCEKDCLKEGIHFRDQTSGPLCDYRYYCDDHVAAADSRSKRQHNRSVLTFKLSLVRKDLASLTQHLRELEDEIEAQRAGSSVG